MLRWYFAARMGWREVVGVGDEKTIVSFDLYVT